MNTDRTTAAVRDAVKPHIDFDDELIVFDVTGVDWASPRSQLASARIG
jgi:hypothetical protein